MIITFSTIPNSNNEKLIIELKNKAKKEFVSFSDLVMAALVDKYGTLLDKKAKND